MRLCLALGKTVPELLENMSSSELSMWKAYYAIEPFGEYRADLRAGLSTSTLVNMQSKRANTKPEDFLLEFKKRSPDVDHAAMMNRFNAMAKQHNEKLARKGK